MKTNEKIRKLREDHQLTQEEMAVKLSMSKQGYAKIERGDTRSNLHRLEQISAVFGIDIIDLLSYGEDSRIQFNNVSNNESVTNTYFSVGKDDVVDEIQRLQAIVSYKDEIIQGLKNENELLKSMNDLLKKQLG
ncbi:helix-turn-helix domain-containing protein [Lonepinella sp. BR2474]|uniref:helix-turn-helix domain-containing protein n=1 Tax=Lonepinella sp. BR2474 TaxID=3434548 RepID=UPI003F6E2D8D